MGRAARQEGAAPSVACAGRPYRVGLMVERTRAWGRHVCEGVASAAQQYGWELQMFNPGDRLRAGELKRCDGFIALVTDRPAAQVLEESGRPVVDVYNGRLSTAFDVVDSDNIAIAQLAARHFITRRFTQFAYCGFDGVCFSDGRRDAFVRTLRHNRFACDCYEAPPHALRRFGEVVIRNERLAPGSDGRQLAAWVQRLPKPVAVFCSHDLRAWQLLNVCRAAGLDVPHDVAILGVDDDALVCAFTVPMLSSIDPDAFEVGRNAAQALAARFADPGRERIEMRVKPKGVTVRASTEVYPLDPPWLSDALVFIRRHVARRTTAADVFAYLGRSHTVVETAFREVLKTTVQKEIMRARIDEARRLLATTSMPVAEIAVRAGFSRVQYLCNSFAAAVGCSPTEYRLRPQS